MCLAGHREGSSEPQPVLQPARSPWSSLHSYVLPLQLRPCSTGGGVRVSERRLANKNNREINKGCCQTQPTVAQRGMAAGSWNDASREQGARGCDHIRRVGLSTTWEVEN
ncbi:hypothetical protein J6590_019805 [Homalodisca vitripennis]|nr:hypothetical protein J6590_019805 [Homalodisca vitripennis]